MASSDDRKLSGIFEFMVHPLFATDIAASHERSTSDGDDCIWNTEQYSLDDSEPEGVEDKLDFVCGEEQLMDGVLQESELSLVDKGQIPSEVVIDREVCQASRTLADVEEDLTSKEDGEGLLIEQDEEDFEDDVGEDRLRLRSQALTFLQSIPSQLLTQLRRSTQTLVNRATETGGILADDSDVGMEPQHRPSVSIALLDRRSGGIRLVSYPGRRPSLRRLACIMKVVECLALAITENTVVTKRDIFYREVALFKTQATVDKLVDDVVATAGFRRRDFNVCASSKGLVASNVLTLTLEDGSQITTSGRIGSLIPPAERITSVEATQRVEWVLIVEKDAVFNTLCRANVTQDIRVGSGVLVTGKGYPDLATLQLLALLSEKFPEAAFHALVDADPHGMGILSVYANGSKSTKHSPDYNGLALKDRLRWMGVKASEVSSLGIDVRALIPLTNSDWNLALSTLRSRSDLPDEWRRELSHMLHTQRKAEIQVLMGGPSGQVAPEQVIRSDAFSSDEDVVDGQGEIAKTGCKRLVEYVISRLQI